MLAIGKRGMVGVCCDVLRMGQTDPAAFPTAVRPKEGTQKGRNNRRRAPGASEFLRPNGQPNPKGSRAKAVIATSKMKRNEK